MSIECGGGLRYLHTCSLFLCKRVTEAEEGRGSTTFKVLERML